MTNKERVLAAIHFEKPEYTPHFVDFTTQMYEKMVHHTKFSHNATHAVLKLS